MRISIFAAIAASLVATAASAVPFDISNGGYTLGSGFGCPTSNQNQSLCLTTNYTLGDPAAFNLTALGQSTSLTVGTVTLADDDANLQGGETDGLDFTAFLDFTAPLAGTVTRLPTTAATTGSFSDAAVDLSFTFTPITVNFGTTGQFTVAFDSLAFTANNQTQTQGVTVTLTRLDMPASDVPEPAMLGLFGLGAIGLGLGRRRKA